MPIDFMLIASPLSRRVSMRNPNRGDNVAIDSNLWLQANSVTVKIKTDRTRKDCTFNLFCTAAGGQHIFHVSGGGGFVIE